MTNTFIIFSVVIVHEFLHLPKPIKLCTLNRGGLMCVNNRSIKLLKNLAGPQISPFPQPEIHRFVFCHCLWLCLWDSHLVLSGFMTWTRVGKEEYSQQILTILHQLNQVTYFLRTGVQVPRGQNWRSDESDEEGKVILEPGEIWRRRGHDKVTWWPTRFWEVGPRG